MAHTLSKWISSLVTGNELVARVIRLILTLHSPPVCIQRSHRRSIDRVLTRTHFVMMDPTSPIYGSFFESHQQPKGGLRDYGDDPVFRRCCDFQQYSHAQSLKVHFNLYST